jgi:hypothetical protein
MSEVKMTLREYDRLSAGDWVLSPRGELKQVGSCHCEGVNNVEVHFMGGGWLAVFDDVEQWSVVAGPGRVGAVVK